LDIELDARGDGSRVTGPGAGDSDTSRWGDGQRGSTADLGVGGKRVQHIDHHHRDECGTKSQHETSRITWDASRHGLASPQVRSHTDCDPMTRWSRWFVALSDPQGDLKATADIGARPARARIESASA